MVLQNLAEAEQALRPFVPLVSQLTGKDMTLQRIFPLMELLGNPQNKLKIIHIAGTSGKTSTAYFMSALLHASGCDVGLTVSPHVDSITERIQINGQPISEAKFCHELGEFLDIVKLAPEMPSYFELMYAFSFWVFERAGVDYVVMETGMGGLHDATNVATNANKVCIITDIGYDHMHILGTTLQKIVGQKVGIVHPGNHLFMYEQADEIMQVVRDWVAGHEAILTEVSEADERRAFAHDLAQVARFQQRNWLLARRVHRYIQERDGIAESESTQLQQTQLIQVPARMEIIKWHGKTLVMDGAHNGQKMATFLDSLKQRFPGQKPAILMALKNGKEVIDLAPLFAQNASRVIVTQFSTSQDLPAISQPPVELANRLQELGVEPVSAIDDRLAALKALLNGPEQICVITGSFYLLSQIRQEAGLR